MESRLVATPKINDRYKHGFRNTKLYLFIT